MLDRLDHKYLNELPFFQEISPSSENIARFLYEQLGAVFNTDNIRVEKVNVWESDYACASYSEE
jgi:6-pyruvoyltetrahydropterin/6-carboxytetrahydropterin synthase